MPIQVCVERVKEGKDEVFLDTSFEAMEIAIGRAPGNDIVLAESDVSGKHAKIFVKVAESGDSTKLMVCDLNSSNGTYVENKQLTPETEYEVEEEKRIVIGSFIVRALYLADDSTSAAQKTENEVLPNHLNNTEEVETPIAVSAESAEDDTADESLPNEREELAAKAEAEAEAKEAKEAEKKAKADAKAKLEAEAKEAKAEEKAKAEEEAKAVEAKKAEEEAKAAEAKQAEEEAEKKAKADAQAAKEEEEAKSASANKAEEEAKAKEAEESAVVSELPPVDENTDPFSYFFENPSLGGLAVLAHDDIRIMPSEGEQLSFGFSSEEEARNALVQACEARGIKIPDDVPSYDTRLSDGTVLMLAFPPFAVKGMSGRMYRGIPQARSLDDCIERGIVSGPAAQFLQLLLAGGANVVFASPIGCDTSDLALAVQELLPEEACVIHVETDERSKSSERATISLQAKQSMTGVSSLASMTETLRMCVQLGPDFLTLGALPKESFSELLEVMNQRLFPVHATVTASSEWMLAQSMLSELGAADDTSTQRSGEFLASALDFIVQFENNPLEGTRVSSITEITKNEHGELGLVRVFTSVETEEGSQELVSCGVTPAFIEFLQESGFEVPAGLFA
jgi:Flp pilus assembly CpaF family ATPase